MRAVAGTEKAIKDDLYRLTTSTNLSTPAESQTFQYDAIGRITYNSRVGSYTYPTPPGPTTIRPHAPLTAGPHTFPNYDNNGNLVVGAGRTLTWDANNRITQATVGSTTTTFTYDAFGERLKKTTGANTTRYPLGDDYEIAPDGTVTKYIGIDGLGVVAKRVGPVASSQTLWHHTDRLGSINVITDAAGAEVFRKKYRPYGETLAESGSNTESRGWNDQRNDTETGLTYLHARYYDPMLGTFLSPDPIGVAGGLNLYGYGFGNPTNYSDRTGLSPRPCEDDDEGFVPADCDDPEDDWWWWVGGGRQRPWDRRYYWEDGLRGRWVPCGINDGCEDDPPQQQTPPNQTPPPTCPGDPSCEQPPTCPGDPSCEQQPPQRPDPGGGSTGPPLVHQGFDPTASAFAPPDPNDLLRMPPSQSFGPYFDRRFDFGRFAKCVEDRRFSNLYAALLGVSSDAAAAGSAIAHTGNAIANTAKDTGRMGIGGVARHPTTWQHRTFRIGGRAAGRLTIGLTIFEGFYDIGTIGSCAAG